MRQETEFAPQVLSARRHRGNAVLLVLPDDEVSESFQEVVKVAQKLVNTVQLFIGLDFHNRIACKIMFHPVHTVTGAPLQDERVIAVREEPKLLVDVVSRALRTLTTMRRGGLC